MSKETTTAGKKGERAESECQAGSGKQAAHKLKSTAADQSKKRYQIDIFKGWCKACGICAAFCPRECIRLDEEGSPLVEDPERCSGCGWCELHCPDFAISVKPVKKNSTADLGI